MNGISFNEQILTMAVGDTLFRTFPGTMTQMEVFRVPGGWIYMMCRDNKNMNVFVPFASVDKENTPHMNSEIE